MILPIAAFVAAAQALPDGLLERVRAGASHIVMPADSVVLPLTGASNLPIISVEINGRGPWQFLIDLGSNVTLLRRGVADSAGADVLVDRPGSDIVRVRSIAIGSARLLEVHAGAYDRLDVDGVLGYNVMRLTPFTLDFPRRRLTLHLAGLPAPDGPSVVPYRVIGRMPHVVVEMAGDTLMVNLNTGAVEAMTVPPDLRQKLRWIAPPVPGRVMYNNQTGGTRVLEGRLADSLRLGPFILALPLVFVNPDADGAWLGAAGMAGASWTFDTRRNRLRIVPALGVP